ncbi:hypothetical protein OCU04_005760 [Sclerotinia nivalis]|uniref:Uncharacterized protein n=1 Tax=Sclerotinia nivalis TaxID=352851 RepID=A0A9X0ALM0_9HELO|nr:hypothetical protein OCU04_005760 [Sclerotinia nivalis]
MYSFVTDESTPTPAADSRGSVTKYAPPVTYARNPFVTESGNSNPTGESSSRDLGLLDIPNWWKLDAIRKNPLVLGEFSPSFIRPSDVPLVTLSSNLNSVTTSWELSQLSYKLKSMLNDIVAMKFTFLGLNQAS